jgi:arylsulfatase A-like enzyme
MKTPLLLLPAAILATTSKAASPSSTPRLPNIIYILADDMGYGDLSCYGQKHFNTPNIDQLAQSGIRFTQHYAGCSVCAPSRSSLMTGQHTGHTIIRGNKEMGEEGQFPLESKALTIAEVLKDRGYITGLFGKWGLGYPGSEGDPNNQGFDEFFGINCQRLAHNYYPAHLWHNQEKIILKGNSNLDKKDYTPYLIHKEALKFIDNNKSRPFFLFYTSTIPHAELVAPENYMKKYQGKFLPEKNYKGVDSGKNFRNGPYGSQSETHAAFAAMVNVLDDMVGEIIKKLKDSGIYENTMIIFSSDNGPHLEGGADPDYFDSNSIYRGYKRDLYEGGIREPMIASWNGKIKSGTVSDHPSAFWDVFPTLCEVSGSKIPDAVDGISFLPELLGKPQKKHQYLYWEFHEMGGRQAIRRGDWKLIKMNVSDPSKAITELYDIKDDPEEKNNLAQSNPGIVKELYELMRSARTESAVFKFSSPTIIK